MFRQQSQINCNCSLFPPQQPSKVQPFRSPQRPDPHKDNKSKKSLKGHSSSRQKDLQTRYVSTDAMKRSGESKVTQPFGSYETQHMSSIGSDCRQGWESLNNQENMYGNDREQMKGRRKGYELMKISNESVAQVSTRAASPLNPCDLNGQRKVIFNYRNEHSKPTHASTKIYAISPPPAEKIHHKISEHTSASTMNGSCIPNLRKKYSEQPSIWSKESFNNGPMESFMTKDLPSFQSPEQSNLELATVRQRASSNIFALSRLTEMMNQKEETQSIYQDQPKPNEEGVEYSRVLISCKKLMQDTKNCILEPSAQTQLFDYQKPPKPTFTKKSNNLFQQIRLASN